MVGVKIKIKEDGVRTPIKAGGAKIKIKVDGANSQSINNKIGVSKTKVVGVVKGDSEVNKGQVQDSDTDFSYLQRLLMKF